MVKMDFVEGKTLKYYIENLSLNQNSKEKILQALFNKIHFLNENRIVHGDLKPDNIIITQNLSVEIIDFKSALCLNDKDSRIGPGSFIYRAPEVIANDFDVSANLYSLGLIVFFMESGIEPIEIDKSQNPADALGEYFGLAHSPLIRWLVGKLSNPDKNSRCSLNYFSGLVFFTNCNIKDVVYDIRATPNMVDGIFAEYLNGFQYLNPIFIGDFFKIVAVDGNQDYYTKRMRLELCLNGFSTIDESQRECVLDMYSYHDCNSPEILQYIDYNIARDTNDIICQLVTNVPFYLDSLSDYKINMVDLTARCYDHDSFLYASLLFSKQKHRSTFLVMHFLLCDNPSITELGKLDPTVDLYDAAYAVFVGKPQNVLLQKYHDHVEILSQKDRASLLANYFHLLVIGQIYYDTDFINPSILLYEATDPYQILQIIGSNIPPELWNIADLIILIEILFYNEIIWHCIHSSRSDDFLNDPEIIKKAAILFAILLEQDTSKELIEYVCLVIGSFYRKYTFLHPHWISYISDRLPWDSMEKYNLFKEKYEDFARKIFKALKMKFTATGNISIAVRSICDQPDISEFDIQGVIVTDILE